MIVLTTTVYGPIELDFRRPRTEIDERAEGIVRVSISTYPSAVKIHPGGVRIFWDREQQIYEGGFPKRYGKGIDGGHLGMVEVITTPGEHTITVKMGAVEQEKVIQIGPDARWYDIFIHPPQTNKGELIEDFGANKIFW